MRKKAFVLIIAMLLVFGLAACVDNTTTATTTTTTSGTTTSGTTTSGTTTTTTTTGTTTTTTTTGTTTTTTAFSITFSGLSDAGFTPEDVIRVNTWFDLLAGVNATGSDGNNYNDRISLSSYDAACQINAQGQLMSTGPKVCIIQYEVIANMKVARQNRTVKISAAPVTIEFTEMPDAIDNDALFGSDYTVTGDDQGLHKWRYWAENVAVLGTTGFIKVEGGKLIIQQEKIGGVNYALQVIALTNTALVKNQYYKVTMTITSTTDRYIDIVTKAPNNDYANDTHSIIEIKTGTHEYEMVFKANQAVLHFNIMTGVMEGNTDANAGRLEFSDFTLWQGPIVREYEELANFFKNDDVAVGAEMEYITGTDSDYVRKFYYWDQANGNILAGKKLANGFEVTVKQAATDTWGAQLQWNDINKAGTPLIVNGWYKLEMNINSTTARSIDIEITGRTNSLPISKKQSYELVVGDNAIVLEFQSKYDYFFMKMMFGNYGDLVQTGTFVLSGMKLSVEKGTEGPVDPVDPGLIIGNVFGTIANVNEAALGVENNDFGYLYQTGVTTDIPANEFFLWYGQEATGWFGGWTAFPNVTGQYLNKRVVLNIVNEGAPEFWGIQLKYKGSEIVLNTAYSLGFTIDAAVARKIKIEIKNPGFNVNYDAFDINLVPGRNYIELDFIAKDTTFNLQVNIGNFDATDESGIFSFGDFVLSRQTVEVEGLFANGDFATDQAFAAADADGWAYWTTQGATWLGPNDVEYQGTAVIAGGVMTVTTTQTGHIQWAAQIQYNHAGNEKMIVGGVYKVEFDVNSSVATSIVVQLKTAGNFANQDVPVQLNQGDNHVVVYFVAQQERFHLFVLPGLAAPGVLVFDNFKYSMPDMPDPVEPEVLVKAEVVNGIFNGDFNVEGFAIGGEGSGWGKWTTVAENWTKQVDATFAVVNGAVVVTIIDDATNHGIGDYVWSIQFQYRPGTLAPVVVPGKTYVVEFDVHASVGGTFSMEMTTKDNAGNVAVPVTLVEGMNHVVVQYVAFQPEFQLTASIGKYGPATLTFDNFKLYAMLPEEEVEVVLNPIDGGIFNGNFNAEGFAVGGENSGWTKWTTVAETWTKQVDATFAVVDGAVVVTIIDDATNHGIGDHVWSIQFSYRPGNLAPVVVPGKTYVVTFDVHASVGGTFSMELTTTDNVANVAIPVTLVAGMNHVVVEYVAYEPVLKLTACIGKYGPATLTFDNFVLNEKHIVAKSVEPEPEVLVNKIDGRGNEVNTNLYWQKNGPMDPFAVTYDGTKAVVVADKPAGAQWTTIKMPVQGDFSIFGSVRIEVKGPAGTQILFKIDPSYEKWVTLTGELQVVTWDLSGIPANVLKAVPYIYAFPGAHTNDAFTGTFEIVSFKWIRPVNVYTTANPIVDFDFNKNWADQWLEGYQVLQGPTEVVVNYNRTGGDWTHIRSYVSGNLSDFDYIVLEITGPAGKQIIFKAEGPQGNAEVWYTLTGAKDTVVINISALPANQVNAFFMVLIFAEPQVGTASGTFTIHKAVFTNTNPAA